MLKAIVGGTVPNKIVSWIRAPLFPCLLIKPSDMPLRAVNGQELSVTGEVHLQVIIGDWTTDQRFVVTDSLNTGPV